MSREVYDQEYVDNLEAQLARCVERLIRSRNDKRTAAKNWHDSGVDDMLNRSAIEDMEVIDSLPKQAHLDAKILQCAESNYDDHHPVGFEDECTCFVCCAVRDKKEATNG